MFCSHCGNEVNNDAVVCIHCGCSIASQKTSLKNENISNQNNISGLKIAAKILMIISTVIMGIYLIPLAWCIPMLSSYSNKIEKGEPISIGFKVCILIFVSLVAGILLLCDKENQQ